MTPRFTAAGSFYVVAFCKRSAHAKAPRHARGDVMSNQPGDIAVDDRVKFIEPGYKLTGECGRVEGCTPYSALVQFDNGVIATWPKHMFVKVHESEGVPSPPPETKRTGSVPRIADSLTCRHCGGVVTVGIFCPHCGVRR